MAKKNTDMNNAFIKALYNNSVNSIQEVDNTDKAELQQSSSDKKLQYVDIMLMDNAPEEWNRYPRLKVMEPDKYLSVKLSIYEIGVEQPVTLWKQENGRFMVLAGHNRKDISLEILDECKDEEDFDEEKYRYIPAKVYDVGEIDEQRAKDIIDDSNYQRDFSKLPENIKIQILKRNLGIYKRRFYKKGQRIDKLAEEFGMKKSAIYESFSIDEKVIPELQELYFNGKLTRKAILKFPAFDKIAQEWIYKEFKDEIIDEKVKKLRKDMDREKITKLFLDNQENKTKKITVDVPINHIEEFNIMFEKWLNSLE